jgi:glycosyltransferase involved in cell wall biosynthesis
VSKLADLGVPATCLDGPNEVDPRWAMRLRHLVREANIEVVHTHSPLVAAVARPVLRGLPRRHRPALVGTEHNLWSSYRRATRWANRLTLPLEDATIAVSDEVRLSMPPRLAERAEVLVHGVDVEAIVARRSERQDARSELGVGPGEVLVATVANLRSNKDYPTMLRAARAVLDIGVPVRFVSVGQGPLAKVLADERDRLGLGDRFRFLGFRPDPIPVLAAADVFCLSSRFEGLPIALLEALAVGLPVVATRVGGIPSVVNDGTEGILVDPGDASALADGIVALCDASRRSRYAGAAAERATAFGIDPAVRRQQDLYECLARHRS